MLIEPLTIRPDRVKAGQWLALSLVTIAIGLWLVADTWQQGRTGLIAMLAFGLMIAVAGFFGAQFAAPNWFEVRLGPEGVRARTGWQHLDVGWDTIESASIRIAFGEPYLRLTVIEEVDGGWLTRPTAILLPIGTDTAALRMGLARARAVGRVGVDDYFDAV